MCEYPVTVKTVKISNFARNVQVHAQVQAHVLFLQMSTRKLEPGESPEQFVERLRRYLEKWRVMAGYEARYDSLEDMILPDQYFLTCDKSFQTFLKEKGKLSLKEMTKASNDY